MADPSRKPPRAPMDLYLDRMVGEALREARDGTQPLELVPVEQDRPPVLPLPGWRDVVSRDGPPGPPHLTRMTDRFRRMIEAYVSRQAGNA
jgi:hypothetical protein